MDEFESQYDICVTHPDGTAALPERSIRGAVAAALRRHEVRAARLCIVVVDDAYIAQLNETHLAETGPTDVLTFDLRGPLDGAVESTPEIDGDIVLSLETAIREAACRGHSEEAEAALYAVHGTLHLLGYKDLCPEDAARMHVMEDEILQSAGLGTVYRRRRPCA